MQGLEKVSAVFQCCGYDWLRLRDRCRTPLVCRLDAHGVPWEVILFLAPRNGHLWEKWEISFHNQFMNALNYLGWPLIETWCFTLCTQRQTHAYLGSGTLLSIEYGSIINIFTITKIAIGPQALHSDEEITIFVKKFACNTEVVPQVLRGQVFPSCCAQALKLPNRWN